MRRTLHDSFDAGARELRAFRAEGNPLGLGALLDLALATEAEGSGRPTARAKEPLPTHPEGPGDRIQAREILLGPGAVDGADAAIEPAHGAELRIDFPFVEDDPEGHQEPKPTGG